MEALTSRKRELLEIFFSLVMVMDDEELEEIALIMQKAINRLMAEAEGEGNG